MEIPLPTPPHLFRSRNYTCGVPRYRYKGSLESTTPIAPNLFCGFVGIDVTCRKIPPLKTRPLSAEPPTTWSTFYFPHNTRHINTATVSASSIPRSLVQETPAPVTLNMSEDGDDHYANTINNNGGFGTKTATGNSRIFNCKHCQRAFTREEHLTRHILLTHNKLKPFVCGICSRPFSRRDLLLRHAKNLHQGSELAVSRIRKLFKKSADGDEKLQEEQLPEQKRMKMSVDMLVS